METTAFSLQKSIEETGSKKGSPELLRCWSANQNARAERAIQTILYMARTFMVHYSLHWTERGVDDLSLWSFAVKHSVWLYKRLLNQESGITPMEHLTRARSDHRDILHARVWGCPVFVLEPKLQNYQKL